MSAKTASHPFTTVPAVVWWFLVAAGLAGWLLSFFWLEEARVWRALLISFLYFTSLSGGLVVWLAIIEAARGGWAAGFEDGPILGIHFLAPSVAALVLLWLSSPAWAPWYGLKTPQGAWLDNTFLFLRQLGGLLLFWGTALFYLKVRQKSQARRCAALLVIVFCCVFSLMAFDLIMALDYHWHSSLFGGYYFISSLYIAMAAWGVMAALRPHSAAALRHTIGSLLLSFSILTTYMVFCQLLPIWYENLAVETRFLYVRLHTSPNREISYFLLAGAYLAPLVLLLTRRARTSRVSLGSISAAILVLMWVDRWWLVAPSFTEKQAIGLAEISIALAFAGLWGAGVYFSHRGATPETHSSGRDEA